MGVKRVTILGGQAGGNYNDFLGGGGEMGDRIAQFDWSVTSIGTIDIWPTAMKSMLAFVLRSPVPIVTLWGDKGVMIYNDAYRTFAGGRHPALLGTNVLEGWHEVADFNANVMQKVYREGGTLSYQDQELTLIRDGTPKQLWTDLEYSPVLDEDGTAIGVVAIVIETTEKVLANRRLQDDRNRLWAISRDLLLVCTFDGRITAVNPSATRMLGWAEDEMIGHQLAEFIHPADVDRTSQEIEKLGEGITTLAFENRYRMRDGGYRLLAWTAVPDAGRIHAVGRDITEERHMARDRDRIWNLSPVLKVVTDTQGHITDVNPSWTQKLGWSREETLGRRSTDFMVEDENSWQQRVDSLRGGMPLLDYRTTLRTKDGDQRIIQWTTVPENETFYGFGRDITAEVEAAAALAEAEAALRQSQKMEAVGQLTGGIAHDFNNLLQGITGSLEIVQRRVAQGRVDELDRFISGASTAANRAAALTHRLLAFSRRQPLDPKPVRVNALVASMEDLLRRTSGERIELEFVLAGGLWVTKCDPNQLESAILNLAINARDAMPDGGKLTIETCNAHLDRAYVARQRGVRPGQYVCLCVSDTGIGMSADTISKAFEPFFTTKPIGQGTGLGLSMIYGFAQQSEGYAKIYSEVGQGTTFKLYLPRHHGSAEDEEALPEPGPMHHAEEGEVVLVVEDESVVRGLILEELHELGYAALEAVDGTSGLEMLRSKRRIDLLITDIGLPGLNGRQLADAARELRPSLKVLFMTGYAENAALASGFLEPGMEMITKPFAMEALATRIRSMLTDAS
ncbi:PAS domain S-box protein [Novosphingobium sp. Chol11]|jgi:PAS domain S-box-containing protein|uniref:PAS domain S-box protein n=1 Tax=Novosphingobium sp. Chol11 TaxID=1385763 RepID=UPI001C3EE079|nr:PAS domain S-box protein [Novosphingobium sp. Chol11]